MTKEEAKEKIPQIKTDSLYTMVDSNTGEKSIECGEDLIKAWIDSIFDHFEQQLKERDERIAELEELLRNMELTAYRRDKNKTITAHKIEVMEYQKREYYNHKRIKELEAELKRYENPVAEFGGIAINGSKIRHDNSISIIDNDFRMVLVEDGAMVEQDPKKSLVHDTKYRVIVLEGGE